MVVMLENESDKQNDKTRDTIKKSININAEVEKNGRVMKN